MTTVISAHNRAPPGAAEGVAVPAGLEIRCSEQRRGRPLHPLPDPRNHRPQEKGREDLEEGEVLRLDHLLPVLRLHHLHHRGAMAIEETLFSER